LSQRRDGAQTPSRFFANEARTGSSWPLTTVIMDSRKPAVLALEERSIFKGISIGAEGVSSGEVVCNTAMTGYQEILPDPSYAQQIVTLTYPHIGNTGVNNEDVESGRVWAAGLVIRGLPLTVSNWRCEKPLDQYLRENGVVGIA